MYLHHIELNSAPDLETHIEDIVRHMYQDYTKNSKEITFDDKDVTVFIKDRKINAYCHNTWKQIGSSRTV